MSSRLNFQLSAQATGSNARAATFHTLHNEVQTPLFMPVGTQATVKAQLPQTLEDAGTQILLANTYHLLLRPGPVEAGTEVGRRGLLVAGVKVKDDLADRPAVLPRARFFDQVADAVSDLTGDRLGHRDEHPVLGRLLRGEVRGECD